MAYSVNGVDDYWFEYCDDLLATYSDIEYETVQEVRRRRLKDYEIHDDDYLTTLRENYE